MNYSKKIHDLILDLYYEEKTPERDNVIELLEKAEALETERSLEIN